MAALINGTAYSYAQIRIAMFGGAINGVISINYEIEAVKTNEHGIGKVPVARSYGTENYSGDITLSQNAMERIRDVTQTRKLTDIPPFDIVIAFLNPQRPVTHILRDCEFTQDGGGGDKDTPRLTKQLDLIIGDYDYIG